MKGSTSSKREPSDVNQMHNCSFALPITIVKRLPKGKSEGVLSISIAVKIFGITAKNMWKRK